eukprot:GHRR01013658.1.p1 GENE.GHRR01013658.1~~GHRR01013658.1.p1  ORF type:complete len:460 (+),score=87.93 GHRR01013658.1:29-1408(+)
MSLSYLNIAGQFQFNCRCTQCRRAVECVDVRFVVRDNPAYAIISDRLPLSAPSCGCSTVISCLQLRPASASPMFAQRYIGQTHGGLPGRHAGGKACIRIRCQNITRTATVAAQATIQAETSGRPAGRGQTSFHHGITYVCYEGNSFYVKFNNSGARVLVDPWLVGDLQFFEQGWLYTGRKRGCGGSSGVAIDVDQVAADTDAILISQWVDDHTHVPTLTRLPKHIPIVAQPEAAQRIKPLGFKHVTTISPGQTLQLCDGKLQVRATAGALVGPPWSARQNGYILRRWYTCKQQHPASTLLSTFQSMVNGDCGLGLQFIMCHKGRQAQVPCFMLYAQQEQGVETPASLYYEPHCDFDAKSLQGLGPVDVVVSPVQGVLLGGYPLLKGDTNLISLLKLLRPKVLVPLLNADLDQEGQLASLMLVKGSSAAADIRQQLAASGLADTKLEYPGPPGESLALAL